VIFNADKDNGYCLFHSEGVMTGGYQGLQALQRKC